MSKEKFTEEAKGADYFLDITQEVCPLTFVRTKLVLERMDSGSTLEVRLNAGEPLTNVPRAATEQGHTVVSLEPEIPRVPDGVHRLVLRRG
ncbi:MAG: sulfurtransferase TusA family protein [Azospirillaceae bacterium]